MNKKKCFADTLIEIKFTFKLRFFFFFFTNIQIFQTKLQTHDISINCFIQDFNLRNTVQKVI